MEEKNINTGGGAFIGGSVNTGGGDFTGRDKITTTTVTGDNNIVGTSITLQQQYLQQIYRAIEERPNTEALDKQDLKALVDEIKTEDDKGDEANESFIARRMRNIQRMAPDILEVIIATIANPVAGFGMVAQKVAEKMKAEAG